MINPLIEQAQKVLAATTPSDEELLHARSELASFLEALSTGRMSAKVDIDDLEEAERLMRELNREISRRQAGMPSTPTPQPTTTQPKPSAEMPATPLEDTTPSPVTEPASLQTPSAPPPDFSQILQSDGLGGLDSDPLKRFFQSAHDPEAERLMDQAEEAFYKGNYQVAIPLYEKVIQMEPSWVRAQEHHAEAEEYLRSGNIPSVALPPEAGKAYGKAQSAARVFRYQIALNYLQDAFDHLEDAGIKRWREGEDLRADLENQMQAYDVYKEGLNLLSLGDLQAALGKIQTAASAVAIPEYIDKANETRADISAINEISDVVSMSGKIPPVMLAESKGKLERIRMKYGEIEQISRLRTRLDLMIPATIQNLLDNTRRLKQEAADAPTANLAKQKVAGARENLDLLRQLDVYDADSLALEDEISRLETEIHSNLDAITRAKETFETGNKFFAMDSWKISRGARKRFPQDPEVLELKRNYLPSYAVAILALLVIGAIVITGLTIGIRRISADITARNLAKTPTVTNTPTITLTPTLTLTPEPSITPTPYVSPTPTLTPTPTPFAYVRAMYDLYVRSDCYANFNSVGRVPRGTVLTLLPMPEQRFDTFRRECVLVEFRNEGYAIIGYLLVQDLEPVTD